MTHNIFKERSSSLNILKNDFEITDAPNGTNSGLKIWFGFEAQDPLAPAKVGPKYQIVNISMMLWIF